MRRLLGQGALRLGRLTRRLLTVAVTLAVLCAVLLTGFVWRLSQGPIEIAWLVQRIESMVNTSESPTTITVGSAALAWDGFQHGLRSPIDLRLTDIVVADRDKGSRLRIPRADLLLSVSHLFRLRFAPTAIEIDGPRFTLVRAHDGTLSLDLGALQETADRKADPTVVPAAPPTAAVALSDILRELSEPIGDADATDIYGHLRLLRVRDAAIIVRDHSLRTTWTIPTAELELRRRPTGGVDATASMTVALGDERPTLTAEAELRPGDGGARLSVALSPVTPAALARASVPLADGRRLDAPVTIQADIEAGLDLRPRSASARISVGAGTLRVGDGPVPLLGLEARLTATADQLRLDSLQATVQPPNAPPSVLRGSGSATRTADGYTARMTLGFDQVQFPDLPNLWPAGAANDARSWVLENVTAGIARNGQVSVEMTTRPDLSAARVTRVSGGLDAEELTVHWLRPVPPLERGKARLNFVDHDTIEILIASARQRGGRGGTLATSGGRMVITGLSVVDQFTTIEADITGPVPAALGLLKEPRLALLDKQKIDFRDPAGDASVRMKLHFPLEKSLRVEDLEVKVTARLTRLRLAGLVAGRDIDQGEVDLEATNTGLTVKGRAAIAAIPVTIDGTMDFRDGPPTQVQRRFSASGRATAAQLTAAGLDPEGWLTGDVTATAVWSDRRNGTADVQIDGDLTQARLVVPPLLWSKPVGKAARGSGRVQITRDQVRQIDRVTIDGDGVSFRGTVDCADGRITAVRMDRAAFGRNDLRGTVRFPPNQPVAVMLTGTIDVDAKLRERDTKGPAGPEAPPEPAWSIDGQFDRALLSHDLVATNVLARGQFDGRIFSALMIGGSMGSEKPFRLDITGGRQQRSLAVQAADAGALLRGLDLVKTMEGGTLSVAGTFDDRTREHRLTGNAKITDFRVRGSVGLAKLLQAMTLYGLVDVLRGPGIGFTELVAPFHKDQRQIVLNDARAFSPSLGITAKGALLPHEDRVDVEGTIVPAYFFNSLLGNIPLVGKLFSPETGGGVFAARYSVRGPLEDPTVFVNPLSALTPGFLREIFGIF